MTDLIACLSDNNKEIGHLKRVIEGEDWNKVFLIYDSNIEEKIESGKTIEYIPVNMSKTLSELIEFLTTEFKTKVKGTEAAVNLICASGKEHMAVMSAIMKSGLGFRFAAITKEGVKEV